MIFVNVTGGMSREDGGLYPVADTAVWGVRPVRTIGGWSSVEMAAKALTSQFATSGLVSGKQTILS